MKDTHFEIEGSIFRDCADCSQVCPAQCVGGVPNTLKVFLWPGPINTPVTYLDNGRYQGENITIHYRWVLEIAIFTTFIPFKHRALPVMTY